MIGVGDRVVCVDEATYTRSIWVGDAPVVGNIYTVIGIVPSHNPPNNLALILAEIKNIDPSDPEDIEWGYLITRFRKVKTTKTDISIFTQIDRDVFNKELELVE